MLPHLSHGFREDLLHLDAMARFGAEDAPLKSENTIVEDWRGSPVVRLHQEYQGMRSHPQEETMDLNVKDQFVLPQGLEFALDEGWSKIICRQFGGAPGREYGELIQNALDSYPSDTSVERTAAGHRCR